MPNIPTFDNDVTVRAAAAPQYSVEEAAAPGEAIARAGAQVSQVMNEFSARYTDARRQSDTAHYSAQGAQAQGDLQFKWSHVADREQAMAGFDKDAAAARKTLLDSIDDPIVRAHVGANFDGETILRRYDTANAAFGLESNSRVAQIDADNNSAANAAAGASNDLLRAKLVDDRIAAIKGAVAAGWMKPVQGEQMEIGFRSQVQEVQARALTNAAIDAQDGRAAHDVAERLADPQQFPGLLPERREILQSRLENLSYRLDTRAASQQAHQDAVAERDLRLAQGRTEATLLAGINAGHALSDSDILHLANTQRISAGGVEALIAAKNRSEDGHDSPDVTLRLWHAIGTKQASSGDVFNALHSGDISKSTSVTMMRALDAAGARQVKGNETAAFNQLKTVLHGGAVEQGFVDDKSPAAAIWAQAQGEWHGRVTAGGEDPATVLPDMLKRYGSNVPGPTWLGQPKFGVIQSAKDIDTVKEKTLAAIKAGTISAADGAAQAQLLTQYRRFYGPTPNPTAKPAPAKAGIP